MKTPPISLQDIIDDLEEINQDRQTKLRRWVYHKTISKKEADKKLLITETILNYFKNAQLQNKQLQLFE